MGNIYLLITTDDNGRIAIKIGETKNSVDKRISNLSHDKNNPFNDIQEFGHFECDTDSTSYRRRIEATIHDILEKYYEQFRCDYFFLPRGLQETEVYDICDNIKNMIEVIICKANADYQDYNFPPVRYSWIDSWKTQWVRYLHSINY